MKKAGIILSFLISIFMPIASLAQDVDLDVEAKLAIIEPTAEFYEKAEVLAVKRTSREVTPNDSEYVIGSGLQVITVNEITLKILSGKYKGKTKVIEDSISANPLDLKIEAGDRMLVFIQEFNDNEWSVQIQDFYRLPALLSFAGIFLLILVLVGGKQGLKALLSLVLAIILIFYLFIPLALKGYNPVWLSLAVASIITLLVFLIISGFKRKTISAIIGTIGGLIVAAISAIIFGKIAHLTGLGSEESRQLLSQFPKLNFSGLLFSGILIGALGAVMDVSMSISSAASEIKQAHPKIERKELIAACFRVGRDIMATMSNTLIFAYVGSSLFLLLLFTDFGESYLKFLNFDFVAEEVVRSMAGSIGLVLVIPITAIAAGIFEGKDK